MRAAGALGEARGQRGTQEIRKKSGKGDKSEENMHECYNEMIHYSYASLNNEQNNDKREAAFLQIVSLHTFWNRNSFGLETMIATNI